MQCKTLMTNIFDIKMKKLVTFQIYSKFENRMKINLQIYFAKIIYVYMIFF